MLAPVGFQTTFLDFGHVKTSSLALAGFQTTFWDFGHVKTSLLALAGFQTTFGDFGHLKVQKVDLFDYVRNKAMLVLVFILFFKDVSFCFFRRKLIWLLGEK